MECPQKCDMNRSYFKLKLGTAKGVKGKVEKVVNKCQDPS